MLKKFEGFTKGINLGGWLSQCDHTKERHETFITEDNIREISSWGVDHVRVPVDYYIFRDENGNALEDGFFLVDNCISWCKKYNLNMVLDLHKTAGYIFDEEEIPFFFEKDLQDKFVDLWREFAERYSKYNDMLCFELLNEVVDEDLSETWNDIADRAIKAIREVSKDIRIIIGGAKHNAAFCVKNLRAPVDKNMVFTFHCYEPILFTHQSAHWVEGMPLDYSIGFPIEYGVARSETEKYLGSENQRIYQIMESSAIDREFFKKFFAEAVIIAEKYDIPLYCGEYGVIDRAPADATLKWYEEINAAFCELNIARCAWTYKEMDFGIIDDHYKEIKENLIKLL